MRELPGIEILRWPSLFFLWGSREGENLGGKKLEVSEEMRCLTADMTLLGEVEIADRTLLIPGDLFLEDLGVAAEMVAWAIDDGLDGLPIRTQNALRDISHGAHRSPPITRRGDVRGLAVIVNLFLMKKKIPWQTVRAGGGHGRHYGD